MLAAELNGAIYLDTSVVNGPDNLLDEFTIFSGLPVDCQGVDLARLAAILAEAIGDTSTAN